MKKLLAFVVLLASAQALSSTLTKDNSWDEIFAAGAHTYYDYNLGGITLNNACLTPTEVHSIQPVKTCTNWSEVTVQDPEGGSHVDYSCVEYGMMNAMSPRSYQQTFCDEYSTGETYECIKSHTSWMTVPNTMSVGVYEDINGEAGSTYPGFKKDFTFPACH